MVWSPPRAYNQRSHSTSTSTHDQETRIVIYVVMQPTSIALNYKKISRHLVSQLRQKIPGSSFHLTSLVYDFHSSPKASESIFSSLSMRGISRMCAIAVIVGRIKMATSEGNDPVAKYFRATFPVSRKISSPIATVCAPIYDGCLQIANICE